MHIFDNYIFKVCLWRIQNSRKFITFMGTNYLLFFKINIFSNDKFPEKV